MSIWRIAVLLVMLAGMRQEVLAQEAQKAVLASALSPAPEIIEAINGLYSADPVDRLAAIHSLGKSGSKAAFAVPFLTLVLCDRCVLVVPDNTILGKHEVMMSAAASDALVRIGGPAVPALLAAVRSSPDSQTRALAAKSLHEIILEPRGRAVFGPDAAVTTRYTPDEACFTAWLGAMSDPNERVRFYAAEALGRVGPRSSVPLLVKTLKDEDAEVQLAAVKGVAHLRAAQAVPTLIPMLGQGEPFRVAVQEALGSIGAPAVQPLIDAIADKGCPYRENACWALHAVRDRGALPDLHRALEHPAVLVRQWAAETLSAIADPASLDPLLITLKDEAASVRAAAAAALGSIKDGNGRIAGPLMDLLRNDKEWQVRLSAAAALGHLRSMDPETYDTLVRVLSHAAEQDQNPHVRKTADKAADMLERSHQK